MKSLEVDVAIIGGGTAGMGAYRAALAHTPSLLVIQGGPWGTTCARVGCMPSKLLIAAAEAAHAVAEAGGFGVRVAPAQIDGAAVMQRVRDERDRFVGFVTETVDAWPAEHRLLGQARFIDDHTLQVETPEGSHTRVHARRIVIATGSSPQVPPAWRAAAGDRLIVNDDVFAWQTLPASVAVLGAGVIALELAQALHRLGVRVRMYGRGTRLGPLTDPALQAETARVLGAELRITPNAGGLTLQRVGDSVQVSLGSDVETFEWVLAASGRPPNIAGLGLANTTLALKIGRAHV